MTIHAVFADDVEKITGNCAMSGVTIVWVIDDAMPAKASTATISPGRCVRVTADTVSPLVGDMHHAVSM
ncbi:hypothetical protein GCM10010489_40740 [Microbacterium saperdae]|nr:hypothetical protein GCM10010489_40740 [Microbacterium saperdae]